MFNPDYEDDYEDLGSVISFADFSFSEYWKGEQEILTPRLKELGFTDICFVMGERDSFGPLSRICLANKNGKLVKFIYG